MTYDRKSLSGSIVEKQKLGAASYCYYGVRVEEVVF